MTTSPKNPNSPSSAGGRANGIILRKKSLDNYYANPNYCLECKKLLIVKEKQKVVEVKVKKFCNQKCGGKFNNRKRQENKPPKPLEYKFPKPNPSAISEVSGYTKKELYQKRKNWQSANSSIRANSRAVYRDSGKTYVCNNCNYSKHVEISHIQAVSEFSGDALIREINGINNLVALCRNCHWESTNDPNFKPIKANETSRRFHIPVISDAISEVGTNKRIHIVCSLLQ